MGEKLDRATLLAVVDALDKAARSEESRMSLWAEDGVFDMAHLCRVRAHELRIWERHLRGIAGGGRRKDEAPLAIGADDEWLP